MSKITSIISCKGGVGKTTTAVNISSYIHTQGKRVLAVDLDYQHNLSKHFGIFPGHTITACGIAILQCQARTHTIK